MMLFLHVRIVLPVAVLGNSYLIEHLSPAGMRLPKFANRITPEVLPALNNYEGDDPVRIAPFEYDYFTFLSVAQVVVTVEGLFSAMLQSFYANSLAAQ